jgi:hypothetical protein
LEQLRGRRGSGGSVRIAGDSRRELDPHPNQARIWLIWRGKSHHKLGLRRMNEPPYALPGKKSGLFRIGCKDQIELSIA